MTRIERPTTNRNIDLAKEAIHAYTGEHETSQTIWQSIRKRTICLRVQQFLFKAIHNTPMTGEVWFNIQGHQQRGRCAPCDVTENMEHPDQLPNRQHCTSVGTSQSTMAPRRHPLAGNNLRNDLWVWMPENKTNSRQRDKK